jgi:class 3 adenylate cyclase
MMGIREMATIMFLDIKGSTEYGRDTAPDIVMAEFNQMMAEFSVILARHAAAISGYRGDGFMAIARGTNHAERTLSAACELNLKIEEFNVPRLLLQQKPYEVRIGIATGEVCCGNVGAFDKIDYTAIGDAANLAARLENWAIVGQPCICNRTRELVSSRFRFADTGARHIKPKGFESIDILAWDVLGTDGPTGSSTNDAEGTFS